MNKWLPPVVVTLLLAGAGALWHLAGETATTASKVQTLEERTKEDRRETRKAIERMEEKIDKILEELRRTPRSGR